MTPRLLGASGIAVSPLAFGASSLGGVFGAVDEEEGIRAVHAALDAGITLFDVAPAYGGTRAEEILGRALRGIPRDHFVLSTKVGKYTDPDHYGADILDYSRARILASLAESEDRLGTEQIDIVFLHDIEYQDRRRTEQALEEGVATLAELVVQGRIRAFGCGIYPLDLWQRILAGIAGTVHLVHNHYCLNDTRIEGLLPLAQARGLGLINGSPFACGLLTDRGPAAWHPATVTQRAVFRQAAAYCQTRGSSLAKLAFQFASRHVEIPTTLFSSARAASVRQNVAWFHQPIDWALVGEIRAILAPVSDIDWAY